MNSSEISDEHLFNARAESVPHAKTAPAARVHLNELDCVRVAQRLIAESRVTIGLLPLSPIANAADIFERLSRAIAERSDGNVALLRLTDAEFPQGGGALPALEPGMRIKGTWLGPSLALIAPAAPIPPGQQLSTIQALLRYARARVGRVLVDLSSLAAVDVRQALAACHFLDGVALLVAAGVTREAEVVAAQRELGDERNLGALLLKPAGSR